MMMKTLPLYILLAVSFIFNAMAQKQDPNLQMVASFGKSQPIGVSVSSDNRVFVSFPHKDPYLFGLTEIVNGERKAFPNAEWNAVEGDYKEPFVNVHDIYVASDDHLLGLDSKLAPSGSFFVTGGGRDTNAVLTMLDLVVLT